MAIRILTGVIIPDANRKTNGTAVITFNPHGVSGNADGEELDKAGANGNFSNRPGKIVSLRDIKIRDKDTLSGGSQNDFFKVGDNFKSNNTQLEVTWSATGGSEINELSYMIVGDV